MFILGTCLEFYVNLESLLKLLEQCAARSEDDPEIAHLEAELLLLKYINNPKVEEAYNRIVKFYGRCENV